MHPLPAGLYRERRTGQGLPAHRRQVPGRRTGKFVGSLAIICEGLPDMRALGMAVPQFPKGRIPRVPSNWSLSSVKRSADSSLDGSL